jgi:YgiT-type zinc finger domain-containing protein
MKCSIQGCPGEYEKKKIVHTVRHKGKVIVINHVPAEVCTVCGDVLLKPATVRKIETLLKTKGKPAGTVPLYEFA